MFPANRSLWALVASALLGACHPRVDFGPGGEPSTAADLLKRVAVVESAVVSIKGEARLKLDSPGTKGVVTLFAAVTAPAFVHLESLDFFGKPQGVLVSDGALHGAGAAAGGASRTLTSPLETLAMPAADCTRL